MLRSAVARNPAFMGSAKAPMAQYKAAHGSPQRGGL
jgi:hypothetical protein